MLESADELSKAELLGKCFRKYIEGEISKDELLCFWHAVDKCFVDDLKLLKNYDDEETSTVGNFNLASIGFVYNQAAFPAGHDNGLFVLTSFGKQFLEMVL